MDKPRRAWPWIVAVLIGLPVLYVLSFGPLTWLIPYIGIDSAAADLLNAYAAPYDLLKPHCPRPLRELLDWYEQLFLSP